MEKINIITIDTSTPKLKIGISINGKESLSDISEGFNHLENILPVIDRVFKENGFDKKELTSLAVVCGPGSFTGIRIGIATMQAIAYAADIPLAGFSSFDVYADIYNGRNSIVIPLVDAKKKRFYCSFINSGDENLYDYTPLEIIDYIRKSGKSDVIFIGEDFALMKDFADSQGVSYVWEYQNGYDAEALLKYSIKRAENDHWGSAEPVYLRQSEAEIMLAAKAGVV